MKPQFLFFSTSLSRAHRYPIVTLQKALPFGPTRSTFPFCLPFTWPHAPPSLAVPFLTARVPPSAVHTPLLYRALLPHCYLILYKTFRPSCLALSGSAFSTHRDPQPASDVYVIAWCMGFAMLLRFYLLSGYPSPQSGIWYEPYVDLYLCCFFFFPLLFLYSLAFLYITLRSLLKFVFLLRVTY